MSFTNIFMSVMNSYDSGKRIQDSAAGLGTFVTNGIMSAISVGVTTKSPWGALAGGVLGIVSTAIGYYSQEAQRAIDTANELVEKYKQQANEIKNNLSTLKEMESEFARLSKGVDDYGVTTIFAPVVRKRAARTCLKPVISKAA